MFTLIIAESSLELVPSRIAGHPSVTMHARRLGKRSTEILLDNSWHFAAMKGIDNEIKRGRPDIVHLCLLEAVSIPLYQNDMLQVFIHTIDDKVIKIGKNVSIPKSYHRFEGLIEKLYHDKIIAHKDDILLEIKKMTFSELISEIDPLEVIGLSTNGKSKSYSEIATEFDDDTCLVVGGFQKGHFSDEILSKIDHLYSINQTFLEAHVVISRMLYEYEKTIFM